MKSVRQFNTNCVSQHMRGFDRLTRVVRIGDIQAIRPLLPVRNHQKSLLRWTKPNRATSYAKLWHMESPMSTSGPPSRSSIIVITIPGAGGRRSTRRRSTFHHLSLLGAHRRLTRQSCESTHPGHSRTTGIGQLNQVYLVPQRRRICCTKVKLCD